MSAASPLLMVSNRAPVELTRGPHGTRRVARTVGGLAGALDEALRERGGTWVAWVGPEAGEVLAPEVTGLGYPIHGVRLKDHEVNNYYGGFSNQVLWPLCHSLPTLCNFQPAFWGAYRQANARFAAAVSAVAPAGALVWVHDFHLCLVPGLLRAGGLAARVGLFWHVPFPPASVFGICRWREALLDGLLGADLLGFQTAADARNFLESVEQFLGLPIADDPPRVRLPGRDVRVEALPIGIDAVHFNALAEQPAVRERAARLRSALGAEIVLLGVDRLDYTKGILERLVGFEHFLERQPAWRRRVCFVQLTVPSRTGVHQYREMKRAIDETVGRIAGRFTYEGRSPVTYLYTSLGREQLPAYYVAADAALVTPLRDGMNLVAKEYVACRTREDGVLVLSEFAGAAQELREAVLVNPYEPEAIRRRIETALSMPSGERRRRMRALRERVARRDIRWWTTSFLDALDGPVAAPSPVPVEPEWALPP
jgi:alpha,alpha-trehalose-phosphate synthase [UDP-forming]